MDVNDLHEITDTSEETVRILGDLIESSCTEEQLVYRECELDALWRLYQIERASAGAGSDRAFDRLLKIVHDVHDMISLPAPEADVRQAANRLRDLVEHTQTSRP